MIKTMRHSRCLSVVIAMALGVAAPVLAHAEEVCKDSPVPEGWIVVNDRHDDSKCGPNYTTVHNVWILEKYSDRSNGSIMEVCDFNPTPKGWVDINHRHDSYLCSPNIQGTNVKTIKRLK